MHAEALEHLSNTLIHLEREGWNLSEVLHGCVRLFRGIDMRLQLFGGPPGVPLTTALAFGVLPEIRIASRRASSSQDRLKVLCPLPPHATYILKLACSCVLDSSRPSMMVSQMPGHCQAYVKLSRASCGQRIEHARLISSLQWPNAKTSGCQRHCASLARGNGRHNCQGFCCTGAHTSASPLAANACCT
jgi:hypothetical protein